MDSRLSSDIGPCKGAGLMGTHSHPHTPPCTDPEPGALQQPGGTHRLGGKRTRSQKTLGLGDIFELKNKQERIDL